MCLGGSAWQIDVTRERPPCNKRSKTAAGRGIESRPRLQNTNPRLVVFQAPAKQDTEPKAIPPNLGEILAHAFWMEKKGYKAHTVKGAVSSLKSIDRRTSLLDVQEVLACLAQSKLSETRKEGLACNLDRFYKWKGIPFDKPRYKRAETLPFIPTANTCNLRRPAKPFSKAPARSSLMLRTIYC